MNILHDAETYAVVLKLKNNAVFPTAKDRVLYSNHIIIIIIVIIIPTSKNMFQNYPWAQLKNGLLIEESASLTSELNEGILPASRSGHFTYNERASDIHCKVVLEIYSYIHDLYEGKGGRCCYITEVPHQVPLFIEE
jgi:hypothetical protein